MKPEIVTSRPPSLSEAEFIESVLRPHPRVAALDCDGTLWAPDSGEEFFYWEISHRLLAEEVARWALPRYEEYRAGRVGEAEMCGEMVTLHAGLSAAELDRAAEEFFRERIEPKIFLELLQLTRRLQAEGCELWAVSSTNDWVVRAGARRFGIADNHVIAASAVIEDGKVTSRLLRVPTGPDKAVALKTALTGPPDVALGNSLHDLAMLETARQAFVVNPNPELEALARERGWPVYHPAC